MPGHGRVTRDTRRARTKSFRFVGSTEITRLRCITKGFLAQHGKHEDILVSGCAIAHLKERQKAARA